MSIFTEWRRSPGKNHKVRRRNATSREATGTEKSAADDSKDSDEMEWRRQNAEKRQAIEELGQRIDHLFHGDDSPLEVETSEVESYELPDRLSRLQLSSSSSDQPHVMDQSTQRRKLKRQTCKHREQGRNLHQAVTLFREPARINLQGQLARDNHLTIYNKIVKELTDHRSKYPSADLFSCLRNRFESSKRDDMAVMSLILGTDAAETMTGDKQQALTQCELLKHDMRTCTLTNPGIAAAMVYWHMCNYYMMKGKGGLAESAAQDAASCIQHHSPSAWTGRIYEYQGVMYDTKALVYTERKREYQDMALMCFTNSIAHWLHQPCQEEEALYYPIPCRTHIIHIKLDMPTIYTISVFSGSDIVYQRLSNCLVTQGQVTEAQDMLRTVLPQIHTLTAGRRPDINERVLICGIYLNIRLTQLAINDKEYIAGLEHITTGVELYEDWFDHASRYTNTKYAMLPHLVRDTKKVLDSLHDQLVLMLSIRLAPQSVLLSDSLSSELSDAPPSELKQLTDASRRAEKQARRDENEFSYSSGDIHTDSKADMSTDAN